MEAKHSDDQIGRARVQNTPELEQYYKDLEQLGAGARAKATCTRSRAPRAVSFTEWAAAAWRRRRESAAVAAVAAACVARVRSFWAARLFQPRASFFPSFRSQRCRPRS